MTKFLLTACACGLFISSALAQDKTPEQLEREENRLFGVEGVQQYRIARNVASGASQRLNFHVSLNPDCTSEGDVHVRVIKQPEHGKVETSTTMFFPLYSKESNRYKCNQHKVKGVLVTYKADKYVGTDAFDVLVIYPGGLAREMQYDITVR
jgi:hypothetical protein